MAVSETQFAALEAHIAAAERVVVLETQPELLAKEQALIPALRAVIAEARLAGKLREDNAELRTLCGQALDLLKPGVSQPHRNIGRGMLKGNLEALETT